MSVSNPLTFPKSASSYSVRIRWFVENCCEIRLSNGKTIVIEGVFQEDSLFGIKRGVLTKASLLKSK